MLIFVAINGRQLGEHRGIDSNDRGVITVFNPTSPFFDEKYMERVSSLPKMVHKRVKGLDFGAKPPRIQLC